MTRLLHDTMTERAERLERPRMNLDVVMASGERRRKRRAAGGTAGVAAACAVLAIGAVAVTGDADDAQAPGYAGAAGFEERKATYATGSTIHYGDDAIDVSRTIHSFVQTDDGFVVSDPEGTVYLADGSSVSEIGSDAVNRGTLKADDSGSYVAWTERSGKRSEFVTYDTETKADVARAPVHGGAGASEVLAVDADGTYVADARGLVRVDLVTGRAEVLRSDFGDTEVREVADGLILRDLNRGHSPGPGVPLGSVLSRDPYADRPRTVASPRDLSPMATYVATDYRDSERIVDTGSNELIPLETESSHEFQSVSQWVDDDTVMVMTLDGLDGDLTMALSRCELPSGTCEQAVDDLPHGSQLPVGENLGG